MPLPKPLLLLLLSSLLVSPALSAPASDLTLRVTTPAVADSAALVERFECEFDLRVTKKGRTLAFFSAAGCMIGAGYGYYRESETTSIIGGIGSLFFSAIGFFANKVGGRQGRSLLGDLNIPAHSPIEDLLDQLHVPDPLKGLGYALIAHESTGTAVAYSVQGSRLRFTAWKATKSAVSTGKRPEPAGRQRRLCQSRGRLRQRLPISVL